MDILWQLLFGPMGAPMGQAQGGSPRQGPARPRRARGTPFTRLLISLLLTLAFGAVYFYFKLPALNVHSGDFYWFIVFLCIVFSVCMITLDGYRAVTPGEYLRYCRKRLAVPFWTVALVGVVVVIGSVVGWALFRAPDYSRLLPVEEGDFTAEVSEISWNQIPMLDEDSSNNLANRKLGELSDLVSQFTVSTSSAQINYQGSPVRVNYLNYGGFFKWWNNYRNGIPAYMTIDMRTQEVSVVRLEEGIKYSPFRILWAGSEPAPALCLPHLPV